ncbi:TPR-like protein, partial [Atractiella rhizophila]
RAAAYSQMGDHTSAIADGTKAAEVDPKFSKAYSRLGHALFSSGKYSEAVKAYEKGLELDPNNAVMKNSLVTAKSKAAAEEDADEDDADDVIDNAGARGGAVTGGMPDLASMANM